LNKTDPSNLLRKVARRLLFQTTREKIMIAFALCLGGGLSIFSVCALFINFNTLSKSWWWPFTLGMLGIGVTILIIWLKKGFKLDLYSAANKIDNTFNLKNRLGSFVALEIAKSSQNNHSSNKHTAIIQSVILNQLNSSLPKEAIILKKVSPLNLSKAERRYLIFIVFVSCILLALMAFQANVSIVTNNLLPNLELSLPHPLLQNETRTAEAVQEIKTLLENHPDLPEAVKNAFTNLSQELTKPIPENEKVITTLQNTLNAIDTAKASDQQKKSEPSPRPTSIPRSTPISTPTSIPISTPTLPSSPTKETISTPTPNSNSNSSQKSQDPDQKNSAQNSSNNQEEKSQQGDANTKEADQPNNAGKEAEDTSKNSQSEKGGENKNKGEQDKKSNGNGEKKEETANKDGGKADDQNQKSDSKNNSNAKALDKASELAQKLSGSKSESTPQENNSSGQKLSESNTQSQENKAGEKDSDNKDNKEQEKGNNKNNGDKPTDSNSNNKQPSPSSTSSSTQQDEESQNSNDSPKPPSSSEPRDAPTLGGEANSKLTDSEKEAKRFIEDGETPLSSDEFERNKRFKESIIQESEDQIDPSKATEASGEIEGLGSTLPKTSIEKIRREKPELLNRSSNQEIPLEYKDTLQD
jgi:hypothetical protein